MQHLSRGRRRDIPLPVPLSGRKETPVRLQKDSRYSFSQIMPDVLDIIIVLSISNELLHILQVALIGEGDVVLGLLLQWFQQFSLHQNFVFCP